MTRTYAILLGALLASVVHAGELYKWVDEHGVTHFSQRPPPNPNRHGANERLRGPKSLSTSRDPAAAPTTRYEGEVRAYDGWANCNSELCQQVRRYDPDCATTYCSRAKRYSGDCTSVACQAKKLDFEQDLEEWLARQP